MKRYKRVIQGKKSILYFTDTMALTRNKVSCAIFGPPMEMPDNKLSTYFDVIKSYNLTKYQMKQEQNNNDPSHKNIAESSSRTVQVEQLWQKASLPIVSHHRILALLKT